MAKLEEVLIDPFEKLYEEEIPKLKIPKISEEKKDAKNKEVPIQGKNKETATNETSENSNISGFEKQIIEAALFTSTKPLKVDEISRIVGISSLGLVKKLIDELKNDYSKRGIEITQLAEGYQMQIKKEFIPKVASLTPHQDLSTGMKKTLALIVYKEPLKQSVLVELQGTKVYDYVRELEERSLIKAEKFGRTKILKLTKEFESYFGVEKEKIKEMVRKEMAKHELKKESEK